MSQVHENRLTELDSLKAFALVMMLVSNFVSDLNFFELWMSVKETLGGIWLELQHRYLFVFLESLIIWLIGIIQILWSVTVVEKRKVETETAQTRTK